MRIRLVAGCPDSEGGRDVDLPLLLRATSLLSDSTNSSTGMKSWCRRRWTRTTSFQPTIMAYLSLCTSRPESVTVKVRLRTLRNDSAVKAIMSVEPTVLPSQTGQISRLIITPMITGTPAEVATAHGQRTR